MGGGNLSHSCRYFIPLFFSPLKSCKVDLIYSPKYGSDSLGANSHCNLRCTIFSFRFQDLPPWTQLTFLMDPGTHGAANSCQVLRAAGVKEIRSLKCAVSHLLSPKANMWKNITWGHEWVLMACGFWFNLGKMVVVQADQHLTSLQLFVDSSIIVLGRKNNFFSTLLSSWLRPMY